MFLVFVVFVVVVIVVFMNVVDPRNLPLKFGQNRISNSNSRISNSVKCKIRLTKPFGSFGWGLAKLGNKTELSQLGQELGLYLGLGGVVVGSREKLEIKLKLSFSWSWRLLGWAWHYHISYQMYKDCTILNLFYNILLTAKH